ncbi:MAG: DUF5702 domain-containing protein [Ignavibacteriales bacterium]
MIKRESGAITVYLCIIFVAMIIVAGILIDASRIRTAEVQIKRAIDSAVSSALSSYDKNLKEQFGLFVLNDNDSERLGNMIKEYMSFNLGTDKSNQGFLDLYGYRVEKIKVTPIYNLTENQAARRQIVEYMKFRAPKQVVESFIGKAKAMADTGKSVELSEMKMQIDKVFMDIVNDVQNINKTGSEINKFDCIYFEKFVKEYSKLVMEYRICKKKVEDIKEKLEEARSAADSVEKAKRIASLISKLYDAINAENKARKKKEQTLAKVNQYLETHKKLCAEVLTYCKRLNSNVIDIKNRIVSLKQYIDNNINNESSEYLKNLANEIIRGTNPGNRKTCINGIEPKIPEKSIIDELESKANFNIGLISSALQEVEIFESKYGTSINYGSPSENLDNYIIPKVSMLKDFDKEINLQTIKAPFSGSTGSDPRKEAKKKAKDKFKEGKNKKKNIIKENLKELPSYRIRGKYPNKIISPDFTKQDTEYEKKYEGFLNNSINSKSIVIPNNEDLNYTGIDKEIDFGNNKFSEKSFDIVAKIGGWFNQVITNGVITLRDELYVDEYIIGMFSNAVPELKNGTNTRKDLRGRQKQNIIDCETEYILVGNTSDKININFVKGQILLIRFAIDTVNVYRDPQKVEAAIAIASAASAWSFGLSEPVIQNLVLCGWGMLDAVNDLDKLMQGEMVPAFKKFEESKADKEQFGFSYHDYLRVFLLLENSDDKMNRIQDLIQLKSGKKLSGYNSYIRVEADVSIKYLFLTKTFMPVDMRTKDGSRHNFKVILYQGY